VSTSPDQLAAMPVALPAGLPGQLAYTAPPGASFDLQSLTFTVDLTASGGADDVFVRILDQSGVFILGACPGAGQQPGGYMVYTLAQDLNPCDGIINPFLNLASDTFAPITLVEGCQILVEARDQLTGSLDSNAVLSDGVAWVAGTAGGSATALAPLLTPIPISEATGSMLGG